LKLAGQLIGQLTSTWKPEQFHDRFAEEIRKLVKAKTAAGKSFEVTPLEHVEEGAASSNVVDLTELLRNSLGKPSARAATRKEPAAAEEKPAAATKSRATQPARAPAATKRPPKAEAARKRA
jgi:DNA end-binding protein Ku